MSSHRRVIAWGIFVAWLSNVYRPAIFTAIAMFPSLAWLRDSDFLSFGIVIAIYAALMHLISPAVDDGRLPSATWALIGALVGAGVPAGLTVVNWPEIQRIWTMPPAGPARDLPSPGPATACRCAGRCCATGRARHDDTIRPAAREGGGDFHALTASNINLDALVDSAIPAVQDISSGKIAN